MRILPEKIQACVQRKGNRAQLFLTTGIQIDRLRNILTGRVPPSPGEIRAIAHALGVDVSEIAASDATPTTTTR